jgi:hypothetical protein
MDLYINIIKAQLDNIIQSNKHYVAAKGDKGKKQSALVLATNICKLEKIIEESLKEIEKAGVDVDRVRMRLDL